MKKIILLALMALLAACTDTVTNTNSDHGIAVSHKRRGNPDSTYYYQIDTTLQAIYLHSKGLCMIETGTHYVWDSTADINDYVYKYTFSNDTLYLKSTDEAVLVRTSGTPGSMDGTWKVVRYYNGLGYEVPGESSGLTANRVITISGDSFKETNELASTYDFTKTMGMHMAMTSIFDAQDGKSNGSGATGASFFNGQDNMDPAMYEYTIVSRTTTSIEILRNGRTFLLEIIDPKITNYTTSLNYKLNSNGKSCTYEYESFSITKETCDWEYPEPLVFSNSESTIFGAEKSNHYDFERCFREMFE